jgi:hypothetical protein
MLSHSVASEDRIVVSEIGEQRSPQTALASTAAIAE